MQGCFDYKITQFEKINAKEKLSGSVFALLHRLEND